MDHVALDHWPPRYNLAPTQEAPAVLAGPDGGRRLGLMRWGLVPRWAEDPSIGSRMINARAETAGAKPAFRDAFRRRRCLIPADGFYEWRAGPGRQGPKTPFHIHRPDSRPFAMAGLWERWEHGDAERLFTFTILTVDAPAWLRPVHHRMPAVLSPGAWDLWLDPEGGTEAGEEALGALESDRFVAREVSTLVNRPSNDEAACREPVPGGEEITSG